MRRISGFLVLTLTALLVAQPVLSLAASPVRVIPTGKVSVLDKGKEVKQFQSEMPLPQGTLMICNGNCLIQTHNLQLVAQDKATLALAEAKEKWDLTIKDGHVDFAIGSGVKPIFFHTPHDLIQAQRAVVSASSAGLVRGYVKVTADGTELAVQEGVLQVATKEGTQVIEPGHSIQLAQVDMGQKKDTDQPPAQQKTDDKKAAGAVVGSSAGVLGGGAGLLGGLTLPIIATTVIPIAAVGIGVGVGASEGNDGSPISPF